MTLRRLGWVIPLIVAVMVTLPAWLSPDERFVGRPEGEIRDHAWIAWLVQHRVWHDGAVPLWFPDVGFPTGIALYPLDPLNQAVMVVLTPVLGLGPALLVLTTALLALSGLAAGRLSRALGQSEAAALGVSVLVPLGPPLLGSFADGQTEGMGACWALFALGTALGPEPWTRARALRLGLEISALIASAPYQAHAWTLMLVPVLWAAWRNLPSPRVAWPMLVCLPIALGCGWALQHAEGGNDGQISARSKGSPLWPRRTNAGVAVLPPVQPQVGASPTVVWPWPRESRVAVAGTGPRRWAGYTVPVLALVGVGFAFRKGRGRAAITAATGLMLYSALTAGSALQYGHKTPLPFDLWYRHYPLGRLAWKPQQYAAPAWQLAAVCAGFAPAGVVGAGVVIFLIEAQLLGPTPLPLPALQYTAPAWTRYVSGPLMEFPSHAMARGGPGAIANDELLAQTVHRQPIGFAFGRLSGGVSTQAIEALARELGWPVRPGPNAVAALRAAQGAGFQHLVVHQAPLTAEERTRLLDRLLPLGPPAEVEAVWIWTLR